MRTGTSRIIFNFLKEVVDANVWLRSYDIRYGATEDLLHVAPNQYMGLPDTVAELNHTVVSISGGLRGDIIENAQHKIRGKSGSICLTI